MTFLALLMIKTNKSCNPGPGTKINKSLFNNVLGIHHFGQSSTILSEKKILTIYNIFINSTILL
jgi:hypothetical protein